MLLTNAAPTSCVGAPSAIFCTAETYSGHVLSIWRFVKYPLTGAGPAQVQHTSGYVCVGMTGRELDRLGVPLMVPPPENEEALRTAFTVTVDLRVGTTTGISAADRCPPPPPPPSRSAHAWALSFLSASLQRCFSRSGVPSCLSTSRRTDARTSQCHIASA